MFVYSKDLSEKFTRNSKKLSENFIKEHKDLVEWECISLYQNLSKEFIKEHNLTINEDNWLYKSKEYKLDKVKESGLYEIIDNKYIITAQERTCARTGGLLSRKSDP